MALSDVAVKAAKPREKPYKLSDEKGLYLLVSSGGGKWWRLKFRVGGKEQLLSLGTYPEVGLKDARDRRDDARRLLAAGINPAVHRAQGKRASADRAANSFEAVAREWLTKQGSRWAVSHAAKVQARLENDIFPYLGGRPVAEITAPEVLAVLRRIEARGAVDTAHRAMQNCGQVLRYAVATGRATSDPTGALRGALTPVRKGHFAAIIEPQRVGQLLRDIDGYRGHVITRAALQLAPLVFVRPGELRRAEWADVDLENAEWRFTASKTGQEHIVPLAAQAVEILADLKRHTAGGRFVFPGLRSGTRPMSENTTLAALRRLGYAKDEMTGHGFRAMARTILEERLGFRPEYVEQQLAHAVRDPLGRAYNRTTHIDERRRMMQAWADYLDGLRTAGTVVTELFRAQA